MPVRITIASLLIVGGGLSCNGPASIPTYVGTQRQRLTGVSYRVAFDAAEAALREHFRIARRNVDQGIIRSAPSEVFVHRDSPHGLSDILKAPRRARRVAEVRIRAEGPDIEILCTVLIQRDQSAALQLLRHERGVDDYPTDTPADRDASTTPEQNAVWSRGKRDRTTERRILASIREKVRRARGDER